MIAAPPLTYRAGFRERHDVRLMVASAVGCSIAHGRFGDITGALQAGDLLVVNVSATMPAAVDGVVTTGSSAGAPVRLHFSQPLAGDLWTVEPRRPLAIGSGPWRDFPGGEVQLEVGTDQPPTVTLLAPDGRSPRLWLTRTAALGDVVRFLARHGQPIRYAHETVARPLADHQTVFATEPGSAEMPSAGRPFTPELIAALVSSGVSFAPLVLHCGVASFEEGESPDAERYRVSETTAALVNQTRAGGGRVIAVGTTSARALETVTDTRGVVHPGEGVTDLLVTPERGVRAIDGIVSGWHDAGASHLQLLEAVGGRGLLERCYAEAHERDYLWHEFGDALLLFG